MSSADLAGIIDAAWEARDTITPSSKGPVRESVEAALEGLDQGRLRVAEKLEGALDRPSVAQEGGAAVVPALRHVAEIPGGPVDAERGPSIWWDKVPSKFAGWDAARFRGAGFRAVALPGGRAPLGSLYRAPTSHAGCRASSTSAPMSTAAPWWTPGRRWAPARRSAGIAISRAASASAACSSPCRPIP